MNKLFTSILAATLLIVAFSCFGQIKTEKQKLSNAADTAAIHQIVLTYCKSVDLADTVLARSIWSNRDSITFIDPRGHSHGWQQIKNEVYKKAMGDMFSKRDLKTISLSIHTLTDDVAWLEFYWVFHATFRSDGKQIITQGRETQLLTKENDGWRIVHIHYSGLPVTAPGQGF